MAERRGVEDLLQTNMLRRLSGAKLSADEASVTVALSPMYLGDVSEKASRERVITAFVRTATTFVLSTDDAPGYSSDLMDVSWVPWDGLPPLPYPRIWIECGHPGEKEPVPFPINEPTPDVDWSGGLWGIGIAGDAIGWTIANLFCDPWSSENDLNVYHQWDSRAHLEYEVFAAPADAGGYYPITDAELDEEKSGVEIAAAMSVWQAILMVQLIDVLGSRHVPLRFTAPDAARSRTAIRGRAPGYLLRRSRRHGG